MGTGISNLSLVLYSLMRLNKSSLFLLNPPQFKSFFHCEGLLFVSLKKVAHILQKLMISERVISIFLAVYQTTILFGSFLSRLHFQSWCLHACLGDRRAFHPLHHCFMYFAFLGRPSQQLLHFSCQKSLIMLIVSTQCCFFFLTL